MRRFDPKRIAGALLAWYDRERKPLPWRDEPTPYRVWVGEVMSQQTSLPVAAARFVEVVAELPDAAALAARGGDALRRLWAGLGYYARARNLVRGAAYIAGDLGGEFPRDAAGWERVPGCGPYTAALIASVCFGERVASVDGNAVRVAARLLATREGPWTPRGRRAIGEALGAVVGASGRPGDLNQAVMQLGQEICRRPSPRCGECPVAGLCEARRRGIAAQCPPPRPRPSPVEVELAAIVPWRADAGRLALVRRGDGFLRDTVGFFLAPGSAAGAAGLAFLGGTIRHTITRHRITCAVALAPCREGRALPAALGRLGVSAPIWIPPQESELRLETSLDRKVLRLLRLSLP